MSKDRFQDGAFRRPSVTPLEKAVTQEKWQKNVEDAVKRWTRDAPNVSLEDWQAAMHNVKPRHVKISRRRRLALKWSAFTYKHVWNHCPRYHADEE